MYIVNRCDKIISQSKFNSYGMVEILKMSSKLKYYDTNKIYNKKWSNTISLQII